MSLMQSITRGPARMSLRDLNEAYDQFTTSEYGKAMKRRLAEMRRAAERVCQQADDAPQVFRAQGALMQIDVMLALFDDTYQTLHAQLEEAAESEDRPDDRAGAAGDGPVRDAGGDDGGDEDGRRPVRAYGKLHVKKVP